MRLFEPAGLAISSPSLLWGRRFSLTARRRIDASAMHAQLPASSKYGRQISFAPSSERFVGADAFILFMDRSCVDHRRQGQIRRRLPSGHADFRSFPFPWRKGRAQTPTSFHVDGGLGRRLHTNACMYCQEPQDDFVSEGEPSAIREIMTSGRVESK